MKYYMYGVIQTGVCDSVAKLSSGNRNVKQFSSQLNFLIDFTANGIGSAFDDFCRSLMDHNSFILLYVMRHMECKSILCFRKPVI